ncbi:lipase chaperone [Photobacterium gaetbulicola]|uniref:Lipase chaperone n=1 Tax=Photobacterium gaetbulicola Gung47 TaxID=658445 RepID=A0A0C5WUT8_9GAMM|nr:lipase secretion chaperone [Photobacterium gaetbulicola]AJR08824.1 putative lipase activator protein [Photobacterium gaetbulicola Gung47]PSU13391.1 lipase chaperone [Photobacterium gaetbulicola]
MAKRSKVIVGVLAIVIGWAGYQWIQQTGTPASANLVQAPSQQDTEVDESSSRELLEYAYSAQGEIALPDIEQRVEAYIEHSGTSLLDQSLLAAFIGYKKALMGLEELAMGQSMGLDKMEQLHIGLLALQQQYFTPEQIAALFGDENRLRSMAIEKKRIEENALDAQDAEEQWMALLAEQPGYIRRSEQNAQLMAALSNDQQLSQQERYLHHVALVGEAGAQRLEAVEVERAAFEASLADYLTQRSVILADEQVGEEMKELQIEQLRQQSFEPKQWKRVAALERINDRRS